MPALSRTLFRDATEGVFQQACDSFTRNGLVHETVYGFDPRCKITSIIALDTPLAGVDAVSIPSPLRDHPDQVQQALETGRAVAAVHAAEAWAVDLTADTLPELLDRLGPGPASAHPQRAEIISTVGYWPREDLIQQHAALIRRYPDGSTALERLPEDRAGQILLHHDAWLARILPQPPQRRT